MKIDPDVTASELIESWINGNLAYVIDALSSDHPGLTAMVIVQGIHDRLLDAGDVNSITNMLLDRRVSLYKEM